MTRRPGRCGDPEGRLSLIMSTGACELSKARNSAGGVNGQALTAGTREGR